MSAFTFSAPIITTEDECAEREALTEKERREIQSDLFGTSENYVEIGETATIRENGAAMLREALDSIPDKKKQAYTTALQRVPHLVERESPLLAFLRNENWDPLLAANALVGYWQARLKMFGGEKAYLPMTLNGAMADEIEHLQKAVVFPTSLDKNGRLVLFMDRARCIKEVAPRDSVVRCFWYALQCIMESDKNQKLGCVALANLRGYDIYKHFDRILSLKIITCVYAMPLKIKAIHVCIGPSNSVYTSVILPVFKHMLGRQLRLRAVFHTGSTSAVESELERYGLQEEHARCVHGGFVVHSPLLHAFLNQRRELEG